MNGQGIVAYLLGLILAPLLLGVINRVKAAFAGRRGPPLCQWYYDLGKLLRKGAVFSRTTTWVFRAGPVAGLSAILLALLFVPFGPLPSVVAFGGDLFLFVYLLGVMRFITVAAALDTGSSFEAMGASREVQFSALAEPALLLGLAALARLTGSVSLSGSLGAVSVDVWHQAGPPLLLILIAWSIVLLTENARIPVDDPNTHLELTMIHEVMVLDHSGPDLAFIQYGAALKLWALTALVVRAALPVSAWDPAVGVVVSLAGFFTVAIGIGVIESTMARLRLVRIPQLLIAAGAFSGLALILLVNV